MAATGTVTLVTGGTGFIGSHLVCQLAESGESVRVLTRKGKPPVNRPELTDLPGVEFVTADLLDPSSLTDLWADVGSVYHLAGWISTRKADAERVTQLNREASLNFLEAFVSHSRQNPQSRMVYLASIFALGFDPASRPNEGADEDVPYNLGDSPVPYFLAKREAELAYREAADKDVPIVFVYPSYCLGAGDVDLSSSQLLWMLLRSVMPAVPKGGWNVMDVRDAAIGLRLGMEKGKVGQRYIVGGSNMTFLQFGKEVARTCGVRKPRGVLPPLLTRSAGWLLESMFESPLIDQQSAWIAARKWYYDDSKARRELGYSSRPLKETLLEAARWFAQDEFAPKPRPKLSL